MINRNLSPIEFIRALTKSEAISEGLTTQKELNKRYKGKFSKWQQGACEELRKGSMVLLLNDR